MQRAVDVQEHWRNVLPVTELGAQTEVVRKEVLLWRNGPIQPEKGVVFNTGLPEILTGSVVDHVETEQCISCLELQAKKEGRILRRLNQAYCMLNPPIKEMSFTFPALNVTHIMSSCFALNLGLRLKPSQSIQKPLLWIDLSGLTLQSARLHWSLGTPEGGKCTSQTVFGCTNRRA